MLQKFQDRTLIIKKIHIFNSGLKLISINQKTQELLLSKLIDNSRKNYLSFKTILYSYFVHV